MKPPYPSDAAPFHFDDSEGAGDWARRLGLGGLGMAVFLVSLSVLFIASLVGYLLVRYSLPGGATKTGISVPVILWVSSAILALSAVTMHVAYTAARRGHLPRLRIGLAATMLLGVAFTGVQVPALITLLKAHAENRHTGLSGLAFCLIVLHAAHVIGGLVCLAWLTRRALNAAGPIPTPASVRLAAAYWHFLELVWLALFGTFILTA